MANSAVGSLERGLAALFASEPDALADPFSLYAELRESAPVCPSPYGVLVSRYDDVKSVITDSSRYSNAPFNAPGALALDATEQFAYDELLRYESLHLGMVNGDQHQRLRRIAHRAFTPRRVARLEESMSLYADDLLTRLAEHEICDFAEFAYKFPLMIISDLIGIPMADREKVHDWSATIGRYKGSTIEPKAVVAAYLATQEFLTYLQELVREQRGSPRASELAVTLIDAEQDERLSLDELMMMILMLLFAGHETTSNLFGNGVLALLSNREQWDALCASPDLAADATEELLRYTTPAQWLSRTAVDDVELGGTVIERGSVLVALIAAANRDPVIFPEPDRLDIARSNCRQHLALGFGPHYCLGQAVARTEARIVFAELARRFPDMELATDSFTWTSSALLRRLASLPVRLGADRGR